MKNGVSLTIVGLVLAGLGIAAPIVWDWWNNSTGITLTHLHTVNIIERKENIDDLSILYKDKPVENLSRITFELKNTGRLPILKADIVNKPNIQLTKGTILASNIEKKEPANIFVALENEKNSTFLNLALLNPSDAIFFSILTDESNPTFVASARIKNIKQLTTLMAEEIKTINSNVSWSIYVVGGFSFLFIIASFGMLTEIPERKKIIAEINENRSPISEGATVVSIKKYIEESLSFLSASEKDEISKKVTTTSDTISLKNANEILELIIKDVSPSNQKGAAFMAFLCGSLGLWYVYGSVIN